MDVAERLALVSSVLSQAADRPNTQEFLARALPELGLGTGPTGPANEGASRVHAAGPPQAQPLEGTLLSAAPTSQELQEELDEILTRRDVEGSGVLLTRIAEIVDFLEGEQVANAWWCHAAAAGDEIALAVIEDLEVDRDSGDLPSDLLAIRQQRNIGSRQ